MSDQLLTSTAYSTIYLQYFQYANGIKPVDATPSFFTQLLDSLKSGGLALAKLVLFLAHIWPVLLVAGIGIWAIRRRGRKKAAASIH